VKILNNLTNKELNEEEQRKREHKEERRNLGRKEEDTGRS
jgi:hypothetical protein